jgi:hypothetical protein
MRYQIAQQRKAFWPQMQWLVATSELLMLEVEPNRRGCWVVSRGHLSPLQTCEANFKRS